MHVQEEIAAHVSRASRAPSRMPLRAVASWSRPLLLLLALSVVALVAPSTAAAVPANDNFANRISTALWSAQFTVTTTGATGELGEQGGSGTLNTAWYQWTPSISGTAKLDTIGCSFDTYLTLFSGTASLSGMSYLTANDDSGGNACSLIQYAVTAGTTYYIQVDGWSSGYGTTPVNINFLPNNNWTGAQPLYATQTAPYVNDYWSPFTNVGADKEVGEPNHAGNAGGTSVWY
jgi:hypothetical protein